MDNKKIEGLRIGNELYTFQSRIGLDDWQCYKFYKITGETPCYWVLNNGSEMVRKKDLKERSGVYSFSRFKIMDQDSTEAKLKQQKFEEDKTNCKHEDGWILKEEIVINSKLGNEDILAEFECNTLGCKERKKFKFDIICLEEVKEND